jgi:hypothetical protein
MDDTPYTRRALFRTALLGAGLMAIPALRRSLLAQPPKAQSAKAPARTSGKTAPMTVYKDPNCGCCKQWVDHVRAAGFVVTVRDTADMAAVKASFGVPEALHSCHTAKVGPYTIEGHVPADLIARMLAEQPTGRGLAVPGMPVGSPGMEMGDRKDPYDVILFEKSGKTRVYARR